MAQALNCLSPVDDEARAARCVRRVRGLRQDRRGQHPDVMLVSRPEDKSAIKIEQVRERGRPDGYRPFEGRSRVVVIDGRMSSARTRRTRC